MISKLLLLGSLSLTGMLIGEAMIGEMEGWFPAITSLSTGTILVWFVYYTLTALLPGLQKEYREAQKEIADTFKDEQRESRKCFEDSCRLIASGFREELRQLPCKMQHQDRP